MSVKSVPHTKWRT